MNYILTLTAGDLIQFTGSESLYQHPLTGLRYTEGVQFVAEKGGAYWLLDAVFCWQFEAKIRAEPFQVWRLTVEKERGALTATDGNDKPLARQRIPYTDFPLPEITLWLVDGVLMLPSEY